MKENLVRNQIIGLAILVSAIGCDREPMATDAIEVDGAQTETLVGDQTLSDQGFSLAPGYLGGLVKAGEEFPFSQIVVPDNIDLPAIFTRNLKFLGGVFNAVLPINGAGENTIIFPVPGLYFYDNAGDRKAILAFGEDQLTNANLAFSLIAILADGGSKDSSSFQQNPLETVIKLLDEPKNVSWNCGPQAASMREILMAMNIESRLVQWFGPPTINGTICDAHQNLEVNLEAYGGWTLYDPHFGLAMEPGFSSLDAFESYETTGSISAHLRIYRNEASWHDQPWAFMNEYMWGVGVYDHDSFTFLITPGVGQSLDEADTSACVGKIQFVGDREEYRRTAY